MNENKLVVSNIETTNPEKETENELIKKLVELIRLHGDNDIKLPISEIDGVKVTDFKLDMAYGMFRGIYISFCTNEDILPFTEIEYNEGRMLHLTDSSVNERRMRIALNLIQNIKYHKVTDEFLFCECNPEDCKCTSHNLESDIHQTFNKLLKKKESIKLNLDECMICYDLCLTKTVCCKKNLCRKCASNDITKCPNCRKSVDSDE